MQKPYCLAPLLAAASLTAQAQATGSVGIGTTTPNASAALEIRSTSQGLLLPRLTLAQRTALTASTTAPPVPGLVIYQTDNTPGLYAFDGTGWVRLGADNLGNHTATQPLDLAANPLVGNGGSTGLTISSTGNVGLGTSAAQPATQRLDVRGNVRLGDDVNGGTGAGQAIEWVGPGVNTDPVGIYRANPGNDASELRVVVGDVADANDKFSVGRMPGTSAEGGIAGGNFTPTFSVSSTGQVTAPGLAGTGTRVVTADAAGTLATQDLPTDNQQLSLSGNTLALTNGGSVTLPTGSGDNLGNHTATQNLNGNKLVAGTTARAVRSGLGLSARGLFTLGAPRVSADSTTGQGVRLPDLDQDFILTSQPFKGQTNPLNVSGAGDRMMWLSYYSAFRAGGVSGNRWNYPYVGAYSVAFGYDNQAGSDYSVLFGSNNRVRAGDYTFITGYQNEAVLGYYGVMLGYQNAYRGYYGFVGGYQSKTQTNTTTNLPSFAFGYQSQARSSQGNCYALGYYAHTGGQSGSFVFADYSPVNTSYQQDSLVSTAQNQFSARFAGGYRLFTTVATNSRNNGAAVADGGGGITPVGVQLSPGGNAWQVISDSTKKERVRLADGNAFLARIGRLRLGSWNYRGQSPDTMRHYGPMAQDFFAAFGHDGVGRIGEPRSINQADFDGVNLIAIQALYRRLLALEADNARLRQPLQAPPAATPATARPARPRAAELAELRRQNEALQAQLAQARAEATAANAQATATQETFEARLRRLEAATGGQAQR